MNPIAEDILMHYGIKRRSGRYPWGSGDSPFQHSGDFLSRVEELESQGYNEKQLADILDMSTTDLRMQLRLAKHERRNLEADRARSLRDDGLSLNEIAQEMGYSNDSSIRALLNENTRINKNRAQETADILRKELETKRMLDVGIGVERELGVSANTLKEATFILQTEGYQILPVGIKQVTNIGKQINTPVLCLPDVADKEPYQNIGDIQSVGDYHSTDGGSTWNKIEYPASISSNRVGIRYGDEGGASKDGVIELRRGVSDLDLGNSHYAQVRVLVDGTHYLKGMAMYSDDIPDGVDVMFNTNKTSGTDKMSVLKKIDTKDPDNPFGASLKANGQSYYTDSDGKQKLSAINKLKEEGDWDTMSRTLSSQFLSKQPLTLIKKQLDLTYADAESEFDETRSLTNPTVKRKMLLDFADNCDSATVHLKAASLPRQKVQVILPLDAMKENEIYAPNYKDGEKVVLIRYPHGGTFEIPELVVNNKNQSGKKILGQATDAVGINSKVAQKLSGADFDGDTVTVIPVNSKVRVRTSPSLKGLENFDPKTEYPYKEGMKVMTKAATQKQMGVISNLITDMTLRGESDDSEMVRAVKHSMVVIDAAKHKLDYQQSEKDNGIAELKKKYQVRVDEDGNVKTGGASTLISRKKTEVRIPERKGSPRIDSETGKITYKESGRMYRDKTTGELVTATQKVKLMSLVDDAYSLSSGTPQESLYADYANKMKSLANAARKEAMTTEKLTYKASSKAAYQNEVITLDAKLNLAAMNAPRERRAQAIANSEVKAKIQSNPDIKNDKKEIKKISNIAINNARAAVGADGKGSRITLSDSEWAAIQAGAISDSKLSQILRYCDSDTVRQKAMPKTTTSLSTAKINKIKNMRLSGYTNAEIAESIGVSTSTVSKYLNGGE